MEIANNIADINILEQKLFKNLALWHDDLQIKKMRVCDIVRLSKKIDTLNYQYSISLVQKPLK